jgi:hypothetical protein
MSDVKFSGLSPAGILTGANSAAETSSASELDMQELQVGCTQDITYMNEGDCGA